MSFFNSLQQYVSDSVANLSLSPKRFSFSREDSTGDSGGRSGSTGSVTATTNTNVMAQSTTPHGFPKVRSKAKFLFRGSLDGINVKNVRDKYYAQSTREKNFCLEKTQSN